MFVFLSHLHLSGQHLVSAVSLVSPPAKKTTKSQDRILLLLATEYLDAQRRRQIESPDKNLLLKIVIAAQLQIILYDPLYHSNQSGQRMF